MDVEDVRREVDIMRHLPPHPNIVSLKDTYEDDTAVHLVMELCEGGELFDRIVARGHYTEKAAALVTKTIVEVVQVGFLLKNFVFLSCDFGFCFDFYGVCCRCATNMGLCTEISNQRTFCLPTARRILL